MSMDVPTILSWKFNIQPLTWGTMALTYLSRGKEDATSHVQVSRALETIVRWQLWWTQKAHHGAKTARKTSGCPRRKLSWVQVSSSPATLDSVSELWFLEDIKQMKLLGEVEWAGQSVSETKEGPGWGDTAGHCDGHNGSEVQSS